MSRFNARLGSALLLAATLVSTRAGAQQLTEAFDSGVPGGWVTINKSSPSGTTPWFQGNAAVFAAQAGASTAYVASNLNASGDGGTISSWLITPDLSLQNGETLTFYTRSETSPPAVDRLQVRACVGNAAACQNVGTLATDVGNFTMSLLDINPTLTTGVYPATWTLQTIVLSGLPAGTSTGRIAFRHFVTSAGPGPTATNSDYIGVDTVGLTSPAVCPTITLSPSSLPGGTTGTAYNQTITASGGTGPYTYAVTLGSLPTGLTLAAGGGLTGTPTVSGNFNFTVTATDASQCTGSKAYSITVACGTVTVLPASLPNGLIGSSYSQQLSATPAGPTTYAVTLGSLPTGLTLDTGSGLISGTPTGSPAVYNFTVTATVGGCTGNRAYSITTTNCAGTPPTATVSGGGTICSGSQQTAQISAALTGTAPWTVTWSDGNVQPNVQTSPATRNVSPASTTVYTVTAVSDAACTGTFSGQAEVTVTTCNAKSLYTVTPCRIVDTRNANGPQGGPALQAGASRSFPVTGTCGIPESATAVSVNLTVTSPTVGGNLRAYPAGGTQPDTSTINFNPGQTRANNALVQLGTGGQLAILCDMPSGTTHFILDIVGYFQ